MTHRGSPKTSHVTLELFTRGEKHVRAGRRSGTLEVTMKSQRLLAHHVIQRHVTNIPRLVANGNTRRMIPLPLTNHVTGMASRVCIAPESSRVRRKWRNTLVARMRVHTVTGCSTPRARGRRTCAFTLRRGHLSAKNATNASRKSRT